MADNASIDELQDMLVSQRAAIVAALEIIHGLAPAEYQERLRMHRLLSQTTRLGTFGSGSDRISRIHGLVRDILEEGAKRPEDPDEPVE